MNRPIVAAVVRHWEDWMDDGPGTLNYWITQFLTGHGYFGSYLYKIKSAQSASCLECGHGDDTVLYTLKVCPAFNDQREILKGTIGRSISMNTLIQALLQGEDKRLAVSNFCRDVLQVKEKRERELEITDRYRRIRKMRRTTKRTRARRKIETTSRL